MPFSAIAFNRGNEIHTAGIALLCDVAQCVGLTQLERVRLLLEAAPPGSGEFSPTCVSCERVLRDLASPLRGLLVFLPLDGLAVHPPYTVTCGVLTARACTATAPGQVAVQWVLKGRFTVVDAAGSHDVLAASPPLLQVCGAPQSDRGNWQAEVEAQCLACAAMPVSSLPVSSWGNPVLWGESLRSGLHGPPAARRVWAEGYDGGVPRPG